MTLEENIQQLRDGLTVTSAQTLRHERRLKEHQQWMEDMERAFARMAAHSEEFDDKMAQVAAAHLLNEEKLLILREEFSNLREELSNLGKKLDGFVDSMRKGGNGHQ